ncbi:MAG: amidohydrolase [Firmicutes bacterium]|nr:amidohydrolase [Bacillota bacterium]
MAMNENITNLIKEKSEAYLEDMIRVRRQIHRYPELGFDEWKTSALVKEELTKAGIPWTAMADTGVVGLIEGKNPGKVVLIRADMDALEIQEETGLEFASEREGIMHACGHDGHTAGLVGAAKILNDLKDQFDGTVKLMFQPSEEYIPGAERMVKEGVLENPKVDFAIGHHLHGPAPKGVIQMRAGGMTAAPDKFTFKIRAIGGHGSTPYLCTDVIALASQAITMMYSTLNRKLGPVDEAVMSICSLHAGKEYNILPGEVTAVGTIRTFDPAIRKMIPETMEAILKAVTSVEDAEYELIMEDEIGPVINDPWVTKMVKEAAVKIVGEDHVEELKTGSLGGEDFSAVTELIPSCYFYVGVSEDMENPTVLHSSTFCWDDTILKTSAAILAQAALEVLK